MAFGVTDQGFNKKRQDVIKTEIDNEMYSIFGDNFALGPSEPFGQVNGLISGAYANFWDIAEQSYNNFNPNYASGNALSNLVLLNNISRLPATSSTVMLTIDAVDGTVIPAGSIVRTSDSGEDFATTISVIAFNAPFEIPAASVKTGPIAGAAGTITEIQTPIFGWTSATNASDASLGTNEETDAELRARRSRSTAIAAQAVLDAMFARVAAIPGVTATIVLENDTSSTDSNGLPPHSFEVVVEGGDDNDLAYTIWETKPAGIGPNGTTTVNIIDSQGFTQEMKFSRPVSKDVVVTLNISTGPNFPSGGEDLIKQNIVDYANGELIEGRGFGVSDDVIYSELFTPINMVQDVSVNTMTINFSGDAPGTANLPVDVREKSNFTTANISITVS